MTEKLSIYVGWDSREGYVSDVCAHSMRRRTRLDVRVEYLRHVRLRQAGVFWRKWVVDGETGNFRDGLDGSFFNTEYSQTRFLVPFLNRYRGWALYCDGDMIFLSDVKKLFGMVDDRYAVMCVKHGGSSLVDSVRMGERLRVQYRRKNWSSFMLWNCGHAKNFALTREYVSGVPAEALHDFGWVS